MVAGTSFAQNDSTITKADTITIGGIIIIKKKNTTGKDTTTSTRVIRSASKPSKVKTNWGILDLGFANLNDDTQYGTTDVNNYLRNIPASQQEDALKLRNGKTSNVNLWIFMQRVNLAKGYLNLKYGLGLEMFNFRYDENISYHKSPSYIFKDSINFSKNKLFASYISVPFMLNVNTKPGQKKGLSFSAGMSAGYLVASRNKQISDERGKVKTKGDFDLEKFRVAYIGELGLGPVRLFGSYSLTPLHEKGLVQYPYSFGIRFSSF